MCHRGLLILAALCRRPVRAHLKSGQSCRLMAVSTGSATRGEKRASLLLWLLCQPEKRNASVLLRLLEFSCSLSALCLLGSPAAFSSCAPGVLLQPPQLLRSWSPPAASQRARLASPGFREHCAQDTAGQSGRHEQDRPKQLFQVYLFFHIIQFCDAEPIGTLAAFLTFSLPVQQILQFPTLASTHCILCPSPHWVHTQSLTRLLFPPCSPRRSAENMCLHYINQFLPSDLEEKASTLLPVNTRPYVIRSFLSAS